MFNKIPTSRFDPVVRAALVQTPLKWLAILWYYGQLCAMDGIFVFAANFDLEFWYEHLLTWFIGR